jgi:hypothetical protein
MSLIQKSVHNCRNNFVSLKCKRKTLAAYLFFFTFYFKTLAKIQAINVKFGQDLIEIRKLALIKKNIRTMIYFT